MDIGRERLAPSPCARPGLAAFSGKGWRTHLENSSNSESAYMYQTAIRGGARTRPRRAGPGSPPPTLATPSMPPPVVWRVDVRLPGKENSNSHGARPVHQINSMIKWSRTSKLSIKNSLSPPVVGIDVRGCELVWIGVRGGWELLQRHRCLRLLQFMQGIHVSEIKRINPKTDCRRI